MAQQHRALSNHVKVWAIAVLCLAAPAVQAQWVNYRAPGVPRTPDGKVNLHRAGRQNARRQARSIRHLGEPGILRQSR